MSKDHLQDLLADKLDELGHVVDAMGMKIEPGIIRTVAALQLLGFGTNGSCEGHVDRGVPTPWVHVGQKREVKWRWEEEEAVRERLMVELGVTKAQIRPGPSCHVKLRNAVSEGVWDWVHEARPKETAAYLVWREEGHQMYMRLLRLVDEFEAGRAKDCFLVLHQMAGVARLEVVDEESEADEHDKARDGVETRLAVRQAKMAAFTAFLLEKIRLDSR